MTKHHYCEFKHNPPETYGDCLRAAIAAMLDVQHIREVPHFFHDGCDGEIGFQRLKAYLNSRGLNTFFVVSADENFDDVLNFMETANPGVRYVLIGSTITEEHAICCAGNKILCNPSWVGSRLTGPANSGYWIIITAIPASLVDD